MTDVAAIREQIDRQIRPGQSATATAPSRAPGPAVIGTTRTTVANRFDWDEASNHHYALYGRSRYAQGRYIGVV
ncbi:MAG: hypothetical protein KAW89_09050 [Armatimonadetes bacterium]|nr:hypothetical protein [Armatimonadota bacterium]